MSQNVWSETKTSLHPCSIESLERVDENLLFLGGLYELTDELAQQRRGSIVLYQFSFDEELTSSSTEINSKISTSRNEKEYNSGSIREIYKINTSGGVLDMKVRSIECLECDTNINPSNQLIAISLSTGRLEIFGYSSRLPNTLRHITSGYDEDDQSLYLSVDWNEKRISRSTISVCTSTQNGSILSFQYDRTGLNLDYKVKNAHEKFGKSMPVWITIYNPYDHQILLSGGDDAMMKIWDRRSSNITPIHSNDKTHQAGVTSAQWHPSNPNVFSTGSYDEYIRIWDNRQLQKPIQEIQTMGGVWRLKWYVCENSMSSYIFSANMQCGCEIIKLCSERNEHESSDRISNIASCSHKDIRNEVNHLAYGIDCLQSKTKSTDNQEFLMSSCSFYDNLIQVWSCQL